MGIDYRRLNESPSIIDDILLSTETYNIPTLKLFFK